MERQYQIELFGSLRVRRGECVVTRFRTRKTSSLLAYLALHPGEHPREMLAELLWPDQGPAARNSLNVALNAVRVALDELKPSTSQTAITRGEGNGSLLEAGRHTVRLRDELVSVDVLRFRAAAQAAHRQGEGTERQHELLERALSLYGGAPLLGLYEEWAVTESWHVESLFFAATARAIACCEELGLLQQGIAHARRGLQADSSQEELHRDLMRLLWKSGDSAAAVRQYAQAERLLRQQSGNTPSEATQQLLQRIRSGAPAQAGAPGGAPESLPTRHREFAQETDSDAAPASAGRAQVLGLPLPQVPQGLPALPSLGTRFFGREAELARLKAMLGSEAGLVTLVGVAGSGKTRLAIELAEAARREAWAAPVWFVPLAGVSSTEFLAPAVLSALGVRLDPTLPAVEQVVRALPATGALLILDNAEHLLPEATSFVQALLSRVPTLRLLVTSRQELQLRNEQTLPVPPLSVPEPQVLVPAQATQSSFPAAAALQAVAAHSSVQMFVDRAQRAKPTFKLTRHNALPVARLCAHLEGLPLALELAAAHAGRWSPSTMLARFESRLRHLGSEAPANYPHAGMRASLAWSYGLLWPELQHFFACLSLFRGGWGAHAAAITLPRLGTEHAEAEQARHYLKYLCSASLVVREPQGAAPEEAARHSSSGAQAALERFHLLEIVREFAQEQFSQLTPQEQAELRRRHCDFFLGLAEEAARHERLATHDTGQPEVEPGTAPGKESRERAEQAWAVLEAELGNVRAALEWALQHEAQAALRLAGAMWRFWEVRGHFVEGRRWLEDSLSQSGTEPSSLRAGALCGAGQLAFMQGDFGGADSLLQQSLREARSISDEKTLAQALLHRGRLLSYQQGISEEAEAHLPEALALLRRQGDRAGIALALVHLSLQKSSRLDFDGARVLLEESLALARELGDENAEVQTLFFLGDARMCAGDWARAHTLFGEALSTALQSSVALPHFAQWGLSHTEREAGNFSAARAHALAALERVRDMQSTWGIIYAIEALGMLAAAQGQDARAALLLGAADAWREAIDFPLPPCYRSLYDRYLSHARASSQGAWLQGRATPPEQAVQIALSPEHLENQAHLAQKKKGPSTAHAAAPCKEPSSTEENAREEHAREEHARSAHDCSAGLGAACALRADAQAGAGRLAWFAGDFAAAHAHFESALATGRQGLGQEHGAHTTMCQESIATALLFLGNLANYQADYDHAEILLRESLQRQRAVGDIAGTAQALMNLSHTSLNRLDFQSASTLLEESVTLTRLLDKPSNLIITLYYVAEVALLRGDHAAAARAADEGVALSRATNDRVGIYYVLFARAWLAREQHRFADAQPDLHEAVAMVQHNGHRWAIPFALEGVAYLNAAEVAFGAAAAESAADAARILGASHALRTAMGLPLAPSYHAVHGKHTALLIAALGADDFHNHHAQGEALSPEAAMALALSTKKQFA